jgi:hypothetical protein
MKKHIIRISKALFVVIVVYLVILVGGFFGVKYGLTNTAGVVDDESGYYQKVDDEISKLEKDKGSDEKKSNDEANRLKNINFCKIKAIEDIYPVNAQKIIAAYEKSSCDPLIAKMVLAVDLRLLDDADFQKKFSDCDLNGGGSDYLIEDLKSGVDVSIGGNVFPWMDRLEWQTIKEATIKDKKAIEKAGLVAGIEPRAIVASMIVEQLRLFNSQRDLFKKFFGPLKILGNANKISLGVMGMKEATATQVESHLKDPSSPYYLGADLENILDYPAGTNVGQMRYDRLTDEKNNHYFSYLYGALYLRQILDQWKRAGYDVQYRMEVLGTLYNVGFGQSKPNPNPKVGGSAINVGSGKYSFGSLAYEFYYSGELADEFPYITK